MRINSKSYYIKTPVLSVIAFLFLSVMCTPTVSGQIVPQTKAPVRPLARPTPKPGPTNAPSNPAATPPQTARKLRIDWAPVEVDARNYPIFRIRFENKGEAQLKIPYAFQIKLGVVQTRMVTLKFLKPISEIYGEKIANPTINPGQSGWVELRISSPPPPFFDALDANWGKYLNDLPEKDKKDMRLGVKIELPGASSALVATLDGIYSKMPNYNPVEIDSSKYKLLRVRLQNDGKADIKPGTEVKAYLYALRTGSTKFEPGECIPFYTGMCDRLVDGKAHVIAPIKPGESGWVLINFSAWGGWDQKFKRLEEVIKKDPLLGRYAVVEVKGATKPEIVKPLDPKFWVNK